jgi:hypothetical protein
MTPLVMQLWLGVLTAAVIGLGAAILASYRRRGRRVTTPLLDADARLEQLRVRIGQLEKHEHLNKLSVEVSELRIDLFRRIEELRAHVAVSRPRVETASARFDVAPSAEPNSDRLEWSSPPPSLPLPVEPAVPRVIDEGEALRIFVRWCREERFPDEDRVERSSLRVTGAAGASPDIRPSQFEDARQVTEFARIGAAGSPTAWIVPNPDSYFTPFVPKLFAALAEGWERQPGVYEQVRPMPIRRRDDGIWALD